MKKVKMCVLFQEVVQLMSRKCLMCPLGQYIIKFNVLFCLLIIFLGHEN